MTTNAKIIDYAKEEAPYLEALAVALLRSPFASREALLIREVHALACTRVGIDLEKHLAEHRAEPSGIRLVSVLYKALIEPGAPWHRGQPWSDCDMSREDFYGDVALYAAHRFASNIGPVETMRSNCNFDQDQAVDVLVRYIAAWMIEGGADFITADEPELTERITRTLEALSVELGE